MVARKATGTTTVSSTWTTGPLEGQLATDDGSYLDNFSCRLHHGVMLPIAVIEDPATAESLLDPVRTRLLEALAEPASATMLASRVGLPRQLVNYHLRTLERHGLVELEAERRKGNVTERLMRASAGSYVISPAALTALQPDPGRSPDQRSAVWLLALAARTGARRGRAPQRGHPRAAAAVARSRSMPRDPVRERRGPCRVRRRAVHRGDVADRPLPR